MVGGTARAQKPEGLGVFKNQQRICNEASGPEEADVLGLVLENKMCNDDAALGQVGLRHIWCVHCISKNTMMKSAVGNLKGM